MKKRTRKEIAMSFQQLVAEGKVRKAYEYVASQFRHHNPEFPGGRESLLVAMEQDAKKNPQKILSHKLALEDGDLVAVYSHIKQNPQDRGGALVHIFRFEGDQIVELWDVGQEIPEDSPNENGMF